MRRVLVSALVGLLLLTASAVRAQNAASDELYGNAAQAFYACNYWKALKLLDTAIAYGTSDPRVYYFHGLSRSALGDTDAGNDDFAEAARLEASSGGEAYDVGKALERIQGHTRLVIERYRESARVAAALAKAQYRRRRQPVEQRPAPDLQAPEVMPVPGKGEEMPAKQDDGQPASPAKPAKPANEDPFAAPPAKPAAKAPAAADDPFAAPPK